jgi:membrane-associated protein
MIGFEHLAVSSPLSYLAAFWLPALDVIFPVLPSETVVIALGVATAGSTDPRIILLVFLVALGAFAGDNLAYWIGSRFGSVAERRLFSGERGARRLAWARQKLETYGARLIIVCRFIPGGRTAVTLTCGVIGYPRKSFVPATAFAAVIWASYAYFLGRLGGSAFQSRPWVGLLIALGAALVISALVELIRRLIAWRRRGAAAGSPSVGSPAAGSPTARSATALGSTYTATTGRDESERGSRHGTGPDSPRDHHDRFTEAARPPRALR